MAAVITSDWTGINIPGKFSDFSVNIVKKEQDRNKKELVISFKVDGNNYSIHFDFELECSEYFGYKTTGNVEITKINPDTFTNLTIDHKGMGEDYDYINEMHVKFKLSTDDNEYKIIFYNNHNGYYSHYFILKKNNISIFQTSL